MAKTFTLDLDRAEAKRWIEAHLPELEGHVLHHGFFGWREMRLTVPIIERGAHKGLRGQLHFELVPLVPEDQTHTRVRAWADDTPLAQKMLDQMMAEIAEEEAEPRKGGPTAEPPKAGAADSRSALSAEGQRELVKQYWEDKKAGLFDESYWDESEHSRLTQEEWARRHNVSGRTLRRYIAKHPDLAPREGGELS